MYALLASTFLPQDVDHYPELAKQLMDEVQDTTRPEVFALRKCQLDVGGADFIDANSVWPIHKEEIDFLGAFHDLYESTGPPAKDNDAEIRPPLVWVNPIVVYPMDRTDSLLTVAGRILIVGWLQAKIHRHSQSSRVRLDAPSAAWLLRYDGERPEMDEGACTRLT